MPMNLKRRRSSNYGSRNVSKWARGAALAGKAAYKIARSYTNTRQNVRSAPAPITGESDFRGVYRRRPMPKRRRRSWVKFTRRVKAVAEAQVASQFQVLRRNTTIATGSAGQNFTSLFTVLGGNGGNSETDDIADMAASALAMAGTTGTTGTTLTSAGIRLHISGWMAEVMINNNSNVTTYLDCYYWRTKKDVPTTYANVGAVLNVGFSQLFVPSATPANTALTMTQYGVTPFQCPLFSQCFQVYKKTRIKLGGGGTAQLELRSGKNHYRKFGYDTNFSFLRGVTEGILFVQYGTPNGTTDLIAGPTNVSYSMNVNYTWKRMSDDRMGGGIGTD